LWIGFLAEQDLEHEYLMLKIVSTENQLRNPIALDAFISTYKTYILKVY